ncbi:mechanosensitive ion channel domain-containing protein [Rhizobium rhizogenes]|uniref:mechanosensitive ion channel domain-containing protein n=1 Tax=Rhizobium rhizogenes TaxID=359 RepID=UPI00064695C2|nr:mechanosensitive ion channel domain-containing protein [Rhizobium rhizogenes]NTG32824.1 mechanosensitive ion channel [Rhizobium rhizogenes]NTG52089.1 mechanosensitive ion channel [Rhizobium rhizogenes]NTG97794.1 mechanosensitive ion channel [Rhizobium rhizogenes]NTH16998.1 mechanosensitive ion channel [Rhizobium rhizogenes]NTH29972.1 mechanosensitive ion channel [Rhizobium rhizogenes]
MGVVGGQGRSVGVLLLCLFGFAMPVVALAQSAATTPAAVAAPPPEKVRELIQLMNEPDVKQWLAAQVNTTSSTTAAPASDPGMGGGQMSELSDTLGHTRRHLETVSGAVMTLPSEVMAASQKLEAEGEAAGRLRIGIQALVLFFLGLVAEWVVGRLINAKHTQRTKEAAGVETELQAARFQFMGGVVPAIVHGLATLIPLLIFDWPPIIESFAIACVIAFVSMRLAISIGKLLMELIAMRRASDVLDEDGGVARIAERRRVATYWYRRGALFVIYFSCGWAVMQAIVPLGFSNGARYLVGYTLGIGLFLIAVEAVWSRPSQPGKPGRTAISWLLTVYFAALWCLWVTGFDGLLWVGIYTILLPRALSVSSRAVEALHDAAGGVFGTGSLAAVFLDRGVRALIIAFAAFWLGRMLGVEADMMMRTPESGIDRVARGILGGIVVLLAADLIWHLAKTYIDGKLMQALPLVSDSEELRASRARLQTLLPIFRNILAVVIVIIAIMMVLSGLGIQIGPLIAGAGVVGVAVGFGAQTIVKDVISGMFYLWDDAFRVGEYIESGNHKGVVESFSLRSVKLRHQRGPLATVPFGSLGAVNNMNRDWAIDKIIVKVTYDTDLVKMKRIIKDIGQRLLDDEELAPNIIQTLKMKGVEQFGDFAIEIRLAFTAKPNELSAIRRSALAMIKQAFDENGIQFAFPTVQVAGDRDASAAAARQLMEIRAANIEPQAG